MLIDGTCGFCRTWADRIARVLAAGEAGRVRIVPSQDVDVARWGLSREQVAREVVLVLPDGRSYGGATAFLAWARLGPAPLKLLGTLGALPPARAVLTVLYRLIAANRYRLPGSTRACVRPTTGRRGR